MDICLKKDAVEEDALTTVEGGVFLDRGDADCYFIRVSQFGSEN